VTVLIRWDVDLTMVATRPVGRATYQRVFAERAGAALSWPRSGWPSGWTWASAGPATDPEPLLDRVATVQSGQFRRRRA
jgi:hypothetical protein